MIRVPSTLRILFQGLTGQSREKRIVVSISVPDRREDHPFGIDVVKFLQLKDGNRLSLFDLNRVSCWERPFSPEPVQSRDGTPSASTTSFNLTVKRFGIPSITARERSVSCGIFSTSRHLDLSHPKIADPPGDGHRPDGPIRRKKERMRR